MKLFALFASAAFAADCDPDEEACWDGQNVDSPCGNQISGQSTVNSTCTVSGDNIKSLQAGNGAFIIGQNQFTGYEGISGDTSVVVFYHETFNCDADDNCKGDNSTCWGAEINCVDTGKAVDGTYFMDTMHDGTGNQEGANLQIRGAEPGNILTITLPAGNTGNITSVGFGDVQPVGEGIWTVDLDPDTTFGDLLQLQYNGPHFNLWDASIYNAGTPEATVLPITTVQFDYNYSP